MPKINCIFRVGLLPQSDIHGVQRIVVLLQELVGPKSGSITTKDKIARFSTDILNSHFEIITTCSSVSNRKYDIILFSRNLRVEMKNPNFQFFTRQETVVCSLGTYVRTIVHPYRISVTRLPKNTVTTG